MKLPPILPACHRLFTLILVGSSLIIARSDAATVIQVNDWYTVNPGVASVTGGNTSSPTFNMKSPSYPNSLNFIWSHFTPQTLLAGESLTLSINLTIDYATATSAQFDAFRFGIFSHGSVGSNTTSYPDRIADASAYNNGWTGFMMHAETAGRLYRRETSAESTANFASTLGTTSVSTVSNVIEKPLFQDNTVLQMTLTLQRQGDNLLFYGNFGTDTFSATYANAFSEGYPSTFDSFGLYATSSNADYGLVSIQLSNATITHQAAIPEPPITMLLILSAGMILTQRNKSYLKKLVHPGHAMTSISPD